MKTNFMKKLNDLKLKKGTMLCIGLDPALPEQRKKNTIPQKYAYGKNDNEIRLRFCYDIIEKTKDFCCAYKPNQQYVAGFTIKDHVNLTTTIRNADAVSILDYKLNDIGSSIESALYHIHNWGYDAVTFNPFLGNLETTVRLAHSYRPEIGIIVLTLTSNPEAVRYQKKATIDNTPIFQIIAQNVKKHNADGCVLGATGHVTEEEMRLVRSIVGDDVVFLVPGIGTQKGDSKKVFRAAGSNVLINISRDIIYSNNPRKKAEYYNTLLTKHKQKS